MDYKDININNKYIFAILVIAIIAVLLWLRTGLLQYQGLFEPDGFFYLTALKQAVVNNFIIEKTVTLSGYPWHNGFNEAPFVAYATLIPYFFLRFFGVSLINVMRTIPMLFGILDAIAAYFLVRLMFKSRMLGLLAMFFIAVSSGNIARTAGAVYRGDTFISFFIMLALIFLLLVLEEENAKKRYVYAALAALVVGGGSLIWNGGVIVPALFFMSVVAVVAYGFIAADEKTLKNGNLLMLAMLCGWILNEIYLSLGWVNGSPLSTPSFLYLFIPVAIGALIAQYIIKRRASAAAGSMLSRVTKSFTARVVALTVVALLVIFIVESIASPYVSVLATNGNSIYTYTAGINARVGATTQELQPPTYDFLFASFGLELYLAPLGVVLFLLFAHAHPGSKSNFIRKGRLTINASCAFIVLFVYLLAMIYLQAGAIRYNSMVSIPIALFAAYAVYAIYLLIKNYSVFLAGTEIKLPYVYAGIIFALLLIQASFTAGQSFGSVQADGINPYFLGAMTWLSQNTPTNSTVLALWPDGSVVEGWGNRTSLMDSVGGENGTRIAQFGAFIFNRSADSDYLINTADRPNYLLIRNFWLDELGGIAIEANVTGNLSSYGYETMSGFTIGGNATKQVYQFSGQGYTAEMLIQPYANGSRSILGVVAQTGSNNYQPLKQMLFLNATNDNYTILNSSYNQTVNLTLLVTFDGRNITSAALIGPGLVPTNMFRFLFECSYTQCNFGDGNVSAQLVYANADSKIIKFNYK